MKCNLKIFSFVLLYAGLMSCSFNSEMSEKYYVNLRHTKSNSLFTCKTAGGGESGTFRALREGDEENGIWKIEEYSDKDIKKIANSYCKNKFGVK